MLSTPTTLLSSSWPTVASTTSAEAPGKRAVTSTCGGTMSGNCATGICSSDIAPAITVTMAMTMARRGRSTKTFDIMASPRLRWVRAGGGQVAGRSRRNDGAGPCPLRALRDDQRPRLEPALDHGLAGRPAAEPDPPLLDLVAFADHENEGSRLVDLHRGLRDHHGLLRLLAFHLDADELAIGKDVVAVRDLRLHQGGIRRPVGLHVDEVDAPKLLVERAVGQPHPDPDGVHSLALVLPPELKELPLADREDHPDRILAHDHREHAGLGADDIAAGDGGAADTAGDGAAHFRVTQVYLDEAEIGSRPRQRGGRDALFRDALVERGLRYGVRADELASPVELVGRVRELRLRAL